MYSANYSDIMNYHYIYIYTLSKHIYMYRLILSIHPQPWHQHFYGAMSQISTSSHCGHGLPLAPWPRFFPGTFTAPDPAPSFRASVKTSTATSGALEAGGTVKSGRLLRYPSGNLVGGFKHSLFSIIYGLSSFPLTHIFQRGGYTTNQ